MPKPSRNKKRKTTEASNKDGDTAIKKKTRKCGSRKPKDEAKVAEDKTECVSRKPKNETRVDQGKPDCDSDEEKLEIVDVGPVVDDNIEENLERNASKNNLSVFNVKSIIHHVLSDERVVAMACKAAEEEEKAELNDNDDDEEDPNDLNKNFQLDYPALEPNLTRSRFREVQQTTGAPDPLALVKKALIRSPLKKIISPFKNKSSFQDIFTPVVEDDTVVKIPLAEINFSEGGSSDEEYDPLKEDWYESEDDSESSLSTASDLASPEPLRRTSRVKRKLLTEPGTSTVPPAKQARKPTTSKNAEGEQKSSPFKIPLPVTKKTREQEAKDDLIATRTRSRLPLNDTDLDGLEADFLLPDVTPDMYDLINLDELDSEDLYWHKWLSCLASAKEHTVPTDNEDNEDTEYNFMAEDQKEEKEEYRNDRAVKVSQKELTELLEEFLSECADDPNFMQPENVVFPAMPPVHESGLASEKKEPFITFEQRTLLVTQIQQHTQLLVQIHVLAREHESLQEEASTCRRFIDELCQLKETLAISNSSANQSPSIPPVFSYVGLTEAIRIIDTPFPPKIPKFKLPSIKESHSALPILPKPPETTDTSPERGPPIPDGLAAILWVSPIFIYTGLLPLVGFRSREETSGRTRKFLQAEDNLLVLGIDQFGPNWKLVRDHYLPTKTEKQIRIRRKNLCSNRASDNVMKQFKKTGKIPSLPAALIFRGFDQRSKMLRPNKEIVIVPDVKEKKKRAGRRKKSTIVVQKKPLPLLEIKPEPEKVVVIQNNTPTKALDKAPVTCEKLSSNITIAPRPEKIVVEILPAEPLSESLPVTTFPSAVEKVETQEKALEQTKVKEEVTNDNQIPTQEKEDIPNVIQVTSPLNNENREVVENLEKEQFINSEEFKEILPTVRTETQEDGKIRDRAVAFAQSYLNNVKKCLENESAIYDGFLEVLLKSKCETWSPTRLYKEISVVLHSFPELVRDFVGFLEPQQALEAGVFMTNNEIIRARTFLSRVENHFQKNPAHFQKIIKAFTTYNFKEPKPHELYDTIVPLLKGQQYLIDEFNTFFGHFQPPYSNSDDFEEVELGSGSDIEIDDFEEVTIPELPLLNTKKMPCKNKFATKPSIRLPGTRKQPNYGLTRKGNKLNKKDYDDKMDLEEEGLEDTEEIDDSTRDVNSEGVNEDFYDVKDIEEPYGTSEDTYDKKSQDSDSECFGYNIEDDVDSFADHDSGMSPKRSSSEHSNNSSPGSEYKSGDFLDQNIDSPGTTQDSQMTSSSESVSDLSNEACDIPTTPNSSYENSQDFSDLPKQNICREEFPGADSENDEGLGEGSALNKDSSARDSENFNEFSEERSKESGGLLGEEVFNEAERNSRISANNLELDKDGKSLIVWTRHEDKKILELYQNEGSSENIFNEIAKEVGNRTAGQVEGRFRVLVSLMSYGGQNNESSSEESSSEGDENIEEYEDK